MRAVPAAEEIGAQDAHLAVEVYLHRLRAGIAAMAAAMGGLDALVFTGGVGENAPSIRQRAAEGLRFLGVEVDPDQNQANGGDRNIASDKASVHTLVIAAREDFQIAHETRQVLQQGITPTES
jgi:acetate kinase